MIRPASNRTSLAPRGARWPRRVILWFAVLAAVFFLAAIAFYPLVALGVLLLSHFLLLYPTLVANCQWWGPVRTRFITNEREIWLTIDDGPDPVHTPRMLEILQRFEAKATFFVIGERAAKFRAQVEAIRAAGHELANHTARHPSGTFWCLSAGRIAREIDDCDLPGRYFRAPAGMKNCFVHPVLKRRGMELIGWTVRGLDTVSQDAEAVASRILHRTEPGAIVLLHEGHRVATDPDFHPSCLERTLEELRKANYRCVLPRPEQLQ